MKILNADADESISDVIADSEDNKMNFLRQKYQKQRRG
jgi:hypothetical protein